MKRGRCLSVLLCLVILCLSFGSAAAEKTGLIPVELPPVLVRFADGEVRAEDLRAAVLEEAGNSPHRYELPRGFLNHVMIRLDRRHLGLPWPREAQLQQRMRQSAAAVGGREVLEELLARSNLTHSDAARSAMMEMMLENIVRYRHGMKPGERIMPNEIKAVLEMLRERYQPQWRGLQSPVVAVVGGQHFAAGDVVDYCLAHGRDDVVQATLDGVLNDALLHAEAKRMGIDPAGRRDTALLEAMLGPLLTPESLRQYFQVRRDDFALVQTAYIFCPFPQPLDPQHPDKPSQVEGIEAARQRARNIYLRLRQGEFASFAEAARQESRCPTAALGGKLGYLARNLSVAHGIPPEAYRLDYIPGPKGRISPIRVPPEATFLQVLDTLKKGEYSKPVKLVDGYALIQRLETRYPAGADAILPFLKKYRLASENIRLLQALRKHGAPEFLWTASKRTPVKQFDFEAGNIAAAAPGEKKTGALPENTVTGLEIDLAEPEPVPGNTPEKPAPPPVPLELPELE